MDPALETVMQALMDLAVAKNSGRVSHDECVQVVAGALLAFGVARDELYAEVATLAKAQVARTMDRILVASDARRRSAS
jgi:hypothetical protein